MVQEERRRLRAAFGAALLALGSTPAFQACSSPSRSTGSTPEGGADATDVDASEGPMDGGLAPLDSPGDAVADADGMSCAPLIELDAATTADVGADATACGLVLPCGIPAGLAVSGCDLKTSGGTPVGCRLPDDSGCSSDPFEAGPGSFAFVCNCDIFVGGGRRPPGLRDARRRRGPHVLGEYFATMAFEEAASVRAFRWLRVDLERLDAPAELIRAAGRSARDEVRHARIMARLSRRCGAEPPRVSVRRPRAARDVEVVARENAVEGCVRETYGALLLQWQASHAETRSLRRLFSRIAADELRHAALAWAIARWADTRLTAPARARLAKARRRAAETLDRELAVPHAAEIARNAGLPSASEARLLLASLLPELECRGAQGLRAGAYTAPSVRLLAHWRNSSSHRA